MSVKRLIFALILLEDSKLFQPLSRHARLFKFALTLAALPMLVQYLQEVLRDELLWVKSLFFAAGSVIDRCSIISGRILAALKKRVIQTCCTIVIRCTG